MTSPRHFEVPGVIVYNPEKSLLPSTVVPENFVLTAYNGKTVEIAGVEYYKKQNRVLLYPDGEISAQTHYQLSANAELKFLDGSTPVIENSDFVPSISMAEEVYGLNVTRITYQKDGIYLYDLSGVADFNVTFDVVNATGEAQKDVRYTIMTDTGGYTLKEGTFDIGKDEEITISTAVSGYIMEQGENVEILFGD